MSGFARGIVVIFSVIVMIGIYFILFTGFIEPLGESYVTDCQDKFNCDGVKEDIYKVGGEYFPLISGGGILLWGVVWFVRRSQSTSRGPGGFR